MDIEKKLQSFINKILDIRITAIGAEIVTPGTNASANVIIDNLKHEVVTFAKLVREPHGIQEDMEKSMIVVEGYLMSLQVLGQVTMQKCGSLIDEMYEIIHV